MARSAMGGVPHPAIQKSITQVGSDVSAWTNSIPTSFVATPRQRQKRRIDPKASNLDPPQAVNLRTVPAKMRKQWIHQTMQESTPKPIHVDETSGTEEEHMDIDHGNSTL